MTKRLVLVAVVILTLAVLSACSGEPAAPEPTPGEATGLDGEEIMNAKCTTCHSLERLDGEELDAVGWESVIEEMNEKGAGLNEDEVTALAEYLSLR